MCHLVLLEDEIQFREEVAMFMCKCGFGVTQVGTLAAFEPLIPTVDIAIIDFMLPDGNGLDAIIRLRKVRSSCGIVALSARNSTEDKLSGLYSGADHYLVKPIKLRELAAVVDALKRRIPHGWQLSLQEKALASPECAKLVLSDFETKLIELLVKLPYQKATRKQIAEAYGFNWIDYDMRRLDTMVCRLRQRWREATGTELPLKTEHRYGYSFAVPITLN